jgi:hypothetical protein
VDARVIAAPDVRKMSDRRKADNFENEAIRDCLRGIYYTGSVALPWLEPIVAAQSSKVRKGVGGAARGTWNRLEAVKPVRYSICCCALAEIEEERR